MGQGFPCDVQPIVLHIVILLLCGHTRPVESNRCWMNMSNQVNTPNQVDTPNQDQAAYSGAYEITMDVRWGDQDAMRHVNNAMYFRYFEEARVRLFESLGRRTSKEGFAVLAHISCDFLEPLMYPARITVGMKCQRIGSSSLELHSWIAPADDPDLLHARSRSVVVNTNDAGRPTPWSDRDRAALQAYFTA